MKRIAIATLGCKVNQFESAAFASGFESHGCVLVPFRAEAEVYVINTCAVTAKAGQQSRQLIRRVLHAHPFARLIVTGCYAQMDPNTILDLAERPITIVGNGNKHRLVEAALPDNPPDLVLLMGNIRHKKEICPLPVTRFPDRTRAYLRIQDGCNNFCSYCIVPYTRGPSRSLNLTGVLDQAAVFCDQGYREQVVTGINVGKYGLDLDEGHTIYSLLDRLCHDFPACRFRLSSIEPTEVNDTLFNLLARRANLMPHLHIPLQSGDDAVLARMNRRYSRAEFAAIIHRVRETLPAVTIGCDVLGGFPGETEAEAANTYGLLAELPVDYLHVFPYSRRPGTLAASLPGHLPGPVKEERVRRLRGLDAAKRQALYRANIGRVLHVLVERRQAKSGMLQGFSENYLPVLFAGGSHLIRQVVPVRLIAVEDGQPMGIIADDLLEESRQTR
ncbi:MAG: tRNA (N(6)-L-threonylcarbamoyladenosine(37)-C(2))-methylthiotransferase MtaB [Proteobacteria bacterium]|nr:tRNA (N(6)-L-threonylcarbamoyladenosine(37)-C(2))-methylthiotransferase MtaB [Pseudomonadota bacterium]